MEKVRAYFLFLSILGSVWGIGKNHNTRLGIDAVLCFCISQNFSPAPKQQLVCRSSSGCQSQASEYSICTAAQSGAWIPVYSTFCRILRKPKPKFLCSFHSGGRRLLFRFILCRGSGCGSQYIESLPSWISWWKSLEKVKTAVQKFLFPLPQQRSITHTWLEGI